MNTIFDANRVRVDPKTDSLRLSEAQLESNRMAELDSRLSKSSHLDSLTKIERTLAAPLESVRLNGHDGNVKLVNEDNGIAFFDLERWSCGVPRLHLTRNHEDTVQ